MTADGSRRLHLGCGCSRRDFLARGLYGIGIGAGLPFILDRTSAALTAQALAGTSLEKHPERILVVIELSGGNDGLNTVVPYGDAGYYRARPHLAIRERDTIKIADGFGFHPSMVGFERLYKDGVLAVVHGCGYEHPSLSHFSSMGFWHTGIPNSGEPLGWLGRLADEGYDAATRNVIVNVGSSSRRPCAAGDTRRSSSTIPRASAVTGRSRTACAQRNESDADDDECHAGVLGTTARNATASSDFVRQATSSYQTSVDYGAGGGSPATCRRSRRSSPPGCARASTTSAMRETPSTRTCSRPTSTAGC